MLRSSVAALFQGPPATRKYRRNSSACAFFPPAAFGKGDDVVVVLVVAGNSRGMHKACHACRQTVSSAIMDSLLFH